MRQILRNSVPFAFIAIVTTCSSLLWSLGHQAVGQTYVIEDFDGGANARAQSRTITPDTLTLPFTSSWDAFGFTDRYQSYNFADDSVSIFPGDSFGIVSETKTDFFFGVADLKNDDNPDGGGTAEWTFDISGLTDMALRITFSAMGDYEAVDNSHSFAASIDGGASQSLMSIDADESIDAYLYTMEDGITTNELNDPLVLTDDSGTRVIDNTFTTEGTSAISGSGSLLTLTYTAGVNNGGDEPFAFDDILLVTGFVPPASDADFDGDTDIDGNDLLIWQQGVGVGTTQPEGDANGDGSVDRADLLLWQDDFGPASVAALSAVPEPTAVVMLTLALGLLPVVRRQR